MPDNKREALGKLGDLRRFHPGKVKHESAESVRKGSGRKERNRLRAFQLLSQTPFFNKQLRNLNDAYLVNAVLKTMRGFSSHCLPHRPTLFIKARRTITAWKLVCFRWRRVSSRWRGLRDAIAGSGGGGGAGGAPVLACPAASPADRSCSGRPPRLATQLWGWKPPCLPGVCRL